MFSPVFWQGQKDLNPRHAVLEWMWKQRKGRGERAVLPGSPVASRREDGAGLVLREKEGVKSIIFMNLRKLQENLESCSCNGLENKV